MRTKLIIFDFDGTLGDTRQNIVTTMQMTMKELQLPERSDDECASTIGLPLVGCFRTLYPDLQEGQIQCCADTYRRIFSENLQMMKPQPFPHVIETLNLLKQKGYLLTIASSRSHASLVELTKDMGISDIVSFVIGADDVKEAKPKPEPVLRTLTAMHCNAEDTLVVGDMAVDILMGLNAKAKTCGVTWGNGSKEELKQAGANYIIDKIEELIDLVDEDRYDPIGRAIADYHKNNIAERLRVFSPMFDEDEMPVEVFFRKYEDMPELERIAIDMAKGKVLDVGAGAGCHSLVLQERGLDVTAIDISPLSVETMKERGVKKAVVQDIFKVEEPFDTILMLMNGIGIVGTIEQLPQFFTLLDKIMAPDGQLLCDSSDISYVFEDKDGFIEYPDTDHYFGEVNYTMQYKDTVGKPFTWLYIDAETLIQIAQQNGYSVEIVKEGNHYDYLAKITKK